MKLEHIFQNCLAVSMSKRSDYTSSTDSHENFKRSQEIASWFSDPIDKPYAVLIGTKLARLGSLLSSGKNPANESVQDSMMDLVNYCALWMERRTQEEASDEIHVHSIPAPRNPLADQIISYFSSITFEELEELKSLVLREYHRRTSNNQANAATPDEQQRQREYLSSADSLLQTQKGQYPSPKNSIDPESPKRYR